jgi:hypothetical protein
VIHDDVLDSSPEKQPHPAISPRSISPVEDTDGDSDASLKSSKKPKKKRKKRPKVTFADSDENIALEYLGLSPKKKKKKSKKSGLGEDLATSELVVEQRNQRDGRKRRTSMKSTGPNSKKTEVPDNGLKVGDRVYAEWNKDDWYWAVITAVRRKRKSHYDQYDVSQGQSASSYVRVVTLGR